MEQILSMMYSILSMLQMLIQSMMGNMGSGAGGAGGSDPSGGIGSGGDVNGGGSGGGMPGGDYGGSGSGSDPYSGMSNPGTSGSGGSDSGGYGDAFGSDSTPSASGGDNQYTDTQGGGGNGGIGNGQGWGKNVNVFTSSNADQETVDVYSGGKQVGGYLADLEKGMDQGKSIKAAHDSVGLDNQNPMRNNASDTSLVKGKGGNAVIVTGDNIDPKEADQFADTLRKDYGMNVKVVPNSSPNQLKAALQEMGQQSGEQCLVGVLAHGAKDDSGNNNGNMALGKGDGDQWLKEDMLKSMVNQYLAPNYKNVNVVVSSCFSGNFVQ
jgi:hypothetical protein